MTTMVTKESLRATMMEMSAGDILYLSSDYYNENTVRYYASILGALRRVKYSVHRNGNSIEVSL